MWKNCYICKIWYELHFFTPWTDSWIMHKLANFHLMQAQHSSRDASNEMRICMQTIQNVLARYVCLYVCCPFISAHGVDDYYLCEWRARAQTNRYDCVKWREKHALTFNNTYNKWLVFYLIVPLKRMMYSYYINWQCLYHRELLVFILFYVFFFNFFTRCSFFPFCFIFPFK